MKNEPTNIQALMIIYNATRLAPLKAEEHEFMLKLVKQLEDLITPKGNEPDN